MKKKSITLTVTDGQIDRIVGFGAEAIGKVLRELIKEINPDRLRVQSVLVEHGDEFAADIREKALVSLRNLLITDKFKDEEVFSKYGYLSGYKPIGIEGQIDILRSHWPNLNPDLALRYMRGAYPKFQIPGWIEGPFAIIRPGFFSDKYGEELEEVFKALIKDRKGKFYNYREGQLGPKYLHQRTRTLSKLHVLMEEQLGSDILISPGQFGIRHAGRSVRRALAVAAVSEYGTGARDVGTMLLTNPIRLMHYDDLWIDCAGDEFSPDGDGVFSRAPSFGFSDDRLRFGARDVAYVCAYYGSASAFLPQN